MKINFSKIKLRDIEGREIKNSKIHKGIANAIYMFAKNLDLLEIAIKINKGEEVELRESDIAEIETIINSKEAGFMAFARKAILDTIKMRKGAKK